jgi:hypothetical protein
MVLVAERHWLLHPFAFLGHPRRTLKAVKPESHAGEEQDKKGNARACVCVCAVRKKLRHLAINLSDGTQGERLSLRTS